MELQEVVAKLTASRKLLETKLQGNDTGNIRIEDVEVVYKRYAELRTILQTEYPSLFADLPEHPIPPKTGTNDGRPLTYIYYVTKLIEDMTYCLDLLSSTVTPPGPSATLTREGVFFSGQFFDALLKITDLITQAQKTIVLIDGYVSEDVLKLLTAKSAGVTVSILTKSTQPSLVAAASAFNKQ